MDDKAPGILKVVLIPAVITLVVTVLRLVGELQEWGSPWVNNTAPGGDGEGMALIGTSFMVPVFGLWFGMRIRKLTNQPASVGKSVLLFVAAIGVPIAGFFAFQKMGLVSMPSKENPGQIEGLPIMMGMLVVSLVVALIAWRRLALTLLVYGILARVPVIVITLIAWNKRDEWDTHYTKLPPHVLAEGNDALMALIGPQFSVWIVFTVVVGGIFGCIGGMIAGKKSS